MRFLPLKLVATSLAMVAMTALCVAQEEEDGDDTIELRGVVAGTAEPADPQADESEFVDVEGEVVELESAGAINFMAALDLPIEGLLELGGRIEKARFADDPIELAAAAQLLAAAEEASGQKAPLTAESLREEAISRAKERRQPAELAMVAALINDPESTHELQHLAEIAKSEEAEAQAAAEAGEELRHVRRLLVVNESRRRGYRVRIGWGPYAQHAYVGPGERRMFFNVDARSLRASPTWGGHEQRFELPRHANFYRVVLRGGRPWSGPGWGQQFGGAGAGQRN